MDNHGNAGRATTGNAYRFQIAAAIVILLTGPVLAWSAADKHEPPTSQPAPPQTTILFTFENPLQWTYGSWQNKVVVAGRRARVQGDGVTAEGGAGQSVQMDLRAYADQVPMALIKTGPSNQTRYLRLLLRDSADRLGVWSFPLAAAPGRLTVVPAMDDATLAKPGELRPAKPGEPLDLSAITQWQIQGDYAGGTVMEVEVARVLVAPLAVARQQAYPQSPTTSPSTSPTTTAPQR